jgi:hypothetical protein
MLTVNGAACNSLNFSRLGAYPTAARFSAVLAAADFNQDGFPDTAVLNQDFSNSLISVQLNNGSGGLSAPAGYGTGGQFPNDLKSADLNRDGFPDLLATFGNRVPLKVLLNNGNGGFAAPLSFSGDPFIFLRLATGDFNLDGKLDVAATAREQTPFGLTPRVAIFLGNGQGGLSGPTFLSVGATPVPIVTGDFNQDGFLDLATLNSEHNISVLSGAGNGSFGTAMLFPAGTDTGLAVGSLNLVTADFNQDGKLDLAASERTHVSGQTAGKLSVLLGAGNGSFGSPITLNLDKVESLLAGDFDEDGKPDLAVGMPNATLRVLPGLGTGSFGTPVLLNTASSNVTIIGAADFNLDGHLDLAGVSSENFPANDVVAVQMKVCTAAPTINCPTNIIRSADPGQCSAVVNFTPTATGTPSPTVTCTPASGSVFPNGATTVNCTAANGIGSNASCSFNVTIADSQAPVIICPQNIAQATDANKCSAAVNFTTPAASDNCPGVGAVICSPPSGSMFAKGVTTVACNVSDASGNQNSCSFIVTVSDTQTPAIACPANITQATSASGCSAEVSYATPAASDNCSGVGAVTCVPASGSTFSKGATTVTCSATDASGNNGSCSFTVTVNDTESPAIACPSNVVKGTEPNQCSAVVTYANATATDNCPGVGTPVCSPASGSTFQKGITTVTCTVTDESGNQSAPCSFLVTVNDTEPPSMACPASITRVTDANQCSAVVTYTNATASDNCPGVGAVACSPASGSTFLKGITTVICAVTDASGNQSSCSFTVTVNDIEAPTISCLSPVTQGTDLNQCSAVVTFATPKVSDNCPGVGAVTCSPSSGSTFPKGVTTVTCSATDSSGNNVSCSFAVTVNDTQSPTVICTSSIARATDPNLCSAAITFSASASDNCPSATASCNPPSGSTFPKGITTVSCTATDASGNHSSPCSFTVTVNDSQSPSIVCPANIAKATDPNLCSALVAYSAPSVADNCAGVAAPVCNPPSGSSFPKGVTTVGCAVSDASGNQAACSFTVTVNDLQAPAIACPPTQVRALARPTDTTVVVNYPAPVFADNCPGASVVCNPPSGSAFPLGATTVVCAATDSSGNQASCSFAVTTFDICLQDDSSSAVILFNSSTGDYLFCCDEVEWAGRGTVQRQGSVYTLTHNTASRRVTARFDGGQSKGTASLQSPPGAARCSINDRDTRNNSCACAASWP